MRKLLQLIHLTVFFVGYAVLAQSNTASAERICTR